MTKSFKYFLIFNLFFLSFLSYQSTSAQQLAFPTAYGAGAYTTGGRGGEIVHVTNLNDNGKGSLRQALQMRVPRTIVFDVSGIITLESLLYMDIRNKNVTIAGQTAPEGGITIDGHRIMMEDVDNVIVRYIRFRGGVTARGLGYQGNDSFTSTGSITNQIFDHCSFSWDGDEAASWYSTGGNHTVDKVTVQRSIFGEGTEGSLFGGGAGVKTGELSLHHSIFYNTTHRTPNIAGYNGAKIETINNVVWTIEHRMIQSSGNLDWNHIGNYYDFGNTELNNGVLNMHHAIDRTPPKIYSYGNKIVAVNSNTSRGLTSVSELNADNKKFHRYFRNAQGHVIGEQLNSNYFTNKQHPLLGKPIPVQSAEAAFSSVKNDVGCNARLNDDGSISDNKDVLDSKWLANVINGKYVERSHKSSWKVPRINSVSRSKNFYVSNSHIPEAFFKANVPNGKDHNDIAPSGYTWFEEYLNGVDKSSNDINVTQNVEVTPNLGELQITETLQLNKKFEPQNSSNQKGSWISSDDDIAVVDENGLVTAVSSGSVTIIFKSTLKGVEGESEIIVMPKTIKASAGIDKEICEGESIRLVASGGYSYIWNTGATSKVINVSPTQNTVYTVIAYDKTGKNSDTDDVNVNVNRLPRVNAGQNVTINYGESTILKATGATSYIWNTGDTDAIISVRPTVTTTYTVTGIINGCEGTNTVKVIINNNTSEEDKVSAGKNQSICKYTSTSLTATGGEDYLWSTGQRTQTIYVSPKETTDYSVIAYDSSGKEIGSDEARINVIEMPYVSAGKNVTINLGEKTTLTATGASNYLWSNGATTASITVSPESTTYYSVIGTTAEGCEATNRVLVMLRNTSYYVDIANGFVYNSYSRSSDPSLKKSVNLYSRDDSEISNSLDSSDNVTDTVEDLNTKVVLATTQSENLTQGGIIDVENNVNISIFPNPTLGVINLKISGLLGESRIELYDLSGKLFYKENFIQGNQQSYIKILDLSEYASGIYLLQLTNNKNVITKKLILK